MAGTGGLLWLLLDRTWRHRVALEERHLRMERLESVGRLADGVGHDFTNILTVIRGYTDLLLGQVDEQSWRQDLIQIRGATDRAVSLTSQLISFSQRQPLDVARVNLNDVVLSTLRLTEGLVPPGVEVVNSLDEDPGAVDADPDRLQEALVALLINAVDSLQEAGQIRIDTTAVTITSDRDHPGAVRIPSGSYVRLRVADDGVGMDRTTLERAFEPFFTTRDGAMGLGLSSSYGIVKQHGGHMVATSEPGHGTTIHVYLQRVDRAEGDAEEPSRAGGKCPRTPAPPHGTRILVVVGDLAVRALVVRLLENAGYRVAETGRPQTATAMMSPSGKAPDLVVTDPAIRHDGQPLVETLQCLVPDVPILLISDRAGRAATGHDGDHPILEKPLDAKTLLHEVATLIGDARPRVRVGRHGC